METLSVGTPKPVKRHRRQTDWRTAVLGIFGGVIVLAIFLAFSTLPGQDTQQATAPQRTEHLPLSLPTAPAEDDAPMLTLELYGKCSSAGGTVAGVGTGFTPGARYVIEVYRVLDTLPDVPYTNFDNIGYADSNGRIMDWEWPCKGYAPGNYRVVFTDLGTITSDHPFGDDIGSRFVVLSTS